MLESYQLAELIHEAMVFIVLVGIYLEDVLWLTSFYRASNKDHISSQNLHEPNHI